VQRPVRPWVWLFLNLPFGATSGFVAVTLGFILKAEGLGDEAIAGLVALNLLPHTWKFFWAPVADATLTRKKWYLLANAVSCATILAIAFTPIEKASLPVLGKLIFINSLAITFLGMAVEGLMAHTTPPDQRGRAAGWFQAGNLGGSGVGGGLALLIAEHVSTRAAFMATAAILGACTLALRFVPEVPCIGPLGGRRRAMVDTVRDVGRSFAEVGRDLWKVIASRRGVVGLVLCFLPIGSGAASGLFGAMGDRWHASGSLVAFTAGTLGGTIAAVGCIAGGWFSDRMRRAIAYALSGLFLALVAVGMALAPQSAVFYGVFTLVYSFATGVAYACFTGFVLEIIGTGAAATKYNAFASLSNIPIWYMTLVCGWASEKHGVINMLFVDAGSEIAGILVLLLVIAIVRPGRTPVPDHVATEVAQETDR
jgi:MFS family permease